MLYTLNYRDKKHEEAFKALLGQAEQKEDSHWIDEAIRLLHIKE